jgi:hypothetical protein
MKIAWAIEVSTEPRHNEDFNGKPALEFEAMLYIEWGQNKRDAID